jgi:hypothetical protein
MKNGHRVDRQKVGTKCAGHSDTDAQEPHCFFSLLFSSFTLLFFIFILEGLTPLQSLKTFF